MKKLTITEAAAGPLGEDVRSDAHVRYLAGGGVQGRLPLR